MDDLDIYKDGDDILYVAQAFKVQIKVFKDIFVIQCPVVV